MKMQSLVSLFLLVFLSHIAMAQMMGAPSGNARTVKRPPPGVVTQGAAMMGIKGVTRRCTECIVSTRKAREPKNCRHCMLIDSEPGNSKAHYFNPEAYDRWVESRYANECLLPDTLSPYLDTIYREIDEQLREEPGLQQDFQENYPSYCDRDRLKYLVSVLEQLQEE